ncbi:MAG: glycosyltransferase family A protein [Ignavibacterium sp.]
MIQTFPEHNPTVSIILPTFNRAYILMRSINSVLNQTFKDWELIIVDDGSNDNTFQLINDLINQNYRIRYVKHRNIKLPFSLNIGIQISSGKYLTFLGSDDEYKNNHLELRVNYLESHSDIDLIYGGLEIIGNPFVKDKNDLSKLIHLNDCIVGGTFFGKRNVFIDLNGFKNILYSEDSEFFERAKEKFNIIKVDFQTYIYHREVEDSICNNIG